MSHIIRNGTKNAITRTGLEHVDSDDCGAPYEYYGLYLLEKSV